MANIPQNIRRAHEHTDNLLNQLRGLLLAVDLLADHLPTTRNPAQDALMVLIGMTQQLRNEIERGHDAEWIALCGESWAQAADEIAQAKGELQK